MVSLPYGSAERSRTVPFPYRLSEGQGLEFITACSFDPGRRGGELAKTGSCFIATAGIVLTSMAVRRRPVGFPSWLSSALVGELVRRRRTNAGSEARGWWAVKPGVTFDAFVRGPLIGNGIPNMK